MKKIAILLVVLMLLPVVASAEVPIKTVKAYNFDDHRSEMAVGSALKRDVKIKGLDIDFLLSSPTDEILTSDDKNGIVGISYNRKVVGSYGLTLGLGLGFKDCLDINQVIERQNVEIDRYAYAGIVYKW